MRTVLTLILTTNAPLTLHLHLGRASHAPRPRLTGQPAPDERRPFSRKDPRAHKHLLNLSSRREVDRGQGPKV